MRPAVEAALGRHRAWSIAALCLLTALAWIWLIRGAGMGMEPMAALRPPSGDMAAMPGMMPGMAMDDMMMDGAGAWTTARFALTFSMWWTMMVAMMLPSAAPTILLYARATRHWDARVRPASASFLGGYLIAWGAFALGATTLQLLLENASLIEPMMMASQSRWLTAAILIAAGLYQLGPIKDACLRQCRSPAQFLSRHHRPGQIGALRMGLRHGTYCIGCCGVLMALLFVGGIMNLAWIALLTLVVAAEKLLPHGRAFALAAGWACILWGAVTLLG